MPRSCAERAGLDATVSWLRADLAAVLPQDHLSEEAIQAAAAGEPSPEANEHLRHCPACRAEMDDLRQFIASQRSPGRPRFFRLWVAAAAVFVIAAAGTAWKIVQSRGEPELIASVHDDRRNLRHRPDRSPARTGRASVGFFELRCPGYHHRTVRLTSVAGLSRKPEFLLGDSTKQTAFTPTPAYRRNRGDSSAGILMDRSSGRNRVSREYLRRKFSQGCLQSESDLQRLGCYSVTDAGPGVLVDRDARVGARDIREPVPPAPEAKFAVLSKARMDRLREAERQYPGAHLLLAALYAEAGAFWDARRHLAVLQQANPDSDLVRRLSASLGQ